MDEPQGDILQSPHCEYLQSFASGNLAIKTSMAWTNKCQDCQSSIRTGSEEAKTGIHYRRIAAMALRVADGSSADQ